MTTPQSATSKTATYFVVPVIPDDGTVENAYYYEASPDSDAWTKIASNRLDARGQGCDANQVNLLQPTADAIVQHTGLPIDKLDQTATLYAGVARTLSASADPLPANYAPDGDGTMTIQVLPGTKRGMILVFSRTAPGQLHQIVDLIATTDPEIPNGIG